VIGSILVGNRESTKEIMGKRMNIGRERALGLAAVQIIDGGIVSAPSDASAADQGVGRIVWLRRRYFCASATWRRESIPC
jgi:hypothetical protein